MSKYIDADKLIAEIERRKIILDKYKDSFEEAACCYQDLVWMKDFILSLQQEQPEVDLEKEIDDELDRNWRGHYIEHRRFVESAKYFYKLGLNAKNKD